MGRRAIVAVVAAISVLSALVGWVAGRQIKSPAEIAAAAAPPEPSLITVPVELRELSQRVVVRGTVRASDATELSVTSSSGGSAIITRLPKATGDAIGEGDVAIEVAGRPLIVLQGELPVFRNLIPTLEGPDVRQLEEALNRLGYSPGTIDGKYDAATAGAVGALYRDAGYTPPGDDADDRAALKTARDAVTAAQAGVDSARKELAAARAPLKESDRIQLDRAVTAAQAALEQAKLTAAAEKAEAAKAVTDGERARATAATAVTTATNRLNQARAGTHPDTGLPPTADELAELEAALATAQETLTTADATLAAARAAVDPTTRAQDAAVSDAEINVRLAELDRTERLAGTDTSALQAQVAEAEKNLAAVRTDLADAQARVGAQMPAAELVFLPSLPREVQNVTAEVGDIPSGAVMTVSGSDTVIQSGVSSADRRLIEVGAEALLEDEALGISIPAVVSFVADQPGGADLSSDRYALRLEPTEELPDDALNVNLRISIPVSSSGGEVLAVPFAALSAGVDGTARVEVERSPGQTELVEVVPGLRAEGYVEIDPVAGAELEPGDRVVVGRDLVLPGASSASPGGNSESDDSGDSDSDSGESDSESGGDDEGGDGGA